ncbi:MAG TPA: hypothetical protein PK765_03830 [bacterium]|nr:hypothetical protein [bacterium]
MVIGYVSFLAVFARRMTRFQLFLAIFAVGYMLYVSISTPLFLTLRYHLFALVILNAFVILLVSRFAWR